MVGAASAPWLFGPASDLLLGAGGLYLILFGVLAAAGPAIRGLQPEFLFPLLVLLLSTPHYGSTLLRVYERRQDRRSYVFFSVWASIAVTIAFVAGVRSALVGSLLFTLYLTWSPWHYTGQNYGIALMFLRRRGIEVDAAPKRLIHASFVLSFALFFLVEHSPRGPQASFASGYLSAPGGAVRFIPLGLSDAVAGVLVPLAGIAYLGVLCAAGLLLWRRAASPRDLVPSALLILTQAVWFSFPFLFRRRAPAGLFEPFDARFYGYYLVWIALGHGVQYLWVTAYYARSATRWRGYAHYYGKTLLAGTGIWFVPWLLFAPGALGRLTSDAGLLAPAGASWWVLVAAINIHHFILDGAIWKLRHHRVGSVLIRSAAVPDALADAPSRSWGRRLTWGTAAGGLAIALFSMAGRSAVPTLLERGHYGSAAAVLDGLAWIGQDMAGRRLQLGSLLVRSEQPSEGLRHLERSIDLDPSPEAFLAIGSVREGSGDWEGAAEAYEAGLGIALGTPQLVFALSQANRLREAVGKRDPGVRGRR